MVEFVVNNQKVSLCYCNNYDVGDKVDYIGICKFRFGLDQGICIFRYLRD